MHTVIILSRHASELLQDYRFLFKPFVDNGTVSFCDWNESGTELKTAVPDLYKLMKGKIDWRAVIVDTEPAFGKKSGPVPDKINPFDYPAEQQRDEIPRASSVPVIRLAHMLCGYPSLSAVNFEEGYEFTDEMTGEVHRVRLSELSETEYETLSEKYKNSLQPIYMEEKVPEAVMKARRELEALYYFADIRPREVYLIAARKHPDDENETTSSWRSPFEIESSDFCLRNNYPGICRFLCCNITNPANSRYVQELTEFWLSVLTVTINSIPASSLQAYKLYRLGVTVSEEELSAMLNDHLNKMEAAYSFVQERMKAKPENSFDEDAVIVEPQRVPVIFDGMSAPDLHIDTKHIGLSRDCPQDEMDFWNEAVKEKQIDISRFLKAPRRAIDKAARHLKRKAESFYGEEYELDRFQIADLKDEMNSLELQVLTSDTYTLIDEQRIREELNDTDRQVKKNIAVRMRRNTVIATGAALLLCYMIGYFPYMFNSLMQGGGQFLASIGLTIAAVIVAAAGGLIALLILRWRLRRSMERFNSLMRELVRNVNVSAKKYDKYFSVLCTFMKAQAIYSGIAKKNDSESSRIERLKVHKKALEVSMERDRQFQAAFGLKRTADFEKYVTRFFDEEKKPADNYLYYYRPNMNKSEIPLNKTGEMVKTPYKFIVGLTIEREEIYEEGKGGE